MSSLEDTEPKKIRKILIITASGGGGLIQAANAKEQEEKAKDPYVMIVRKDVLKDWMGAWFGNFCLQKWNRAQISGDVAALRFLIASQYFFDYCCWPYLFLCSFFTLFKEDMDHVIDTQPMGTSAILKALRLYNYWKKKEIVLQKVLVDLPTKAATHFFRPIRRLTKKDKGSLRLMTIAPLLDEGQTAEMFWQENCRMSETQVCYEDFCVRQAFRKFQNRPRTQEPFSLRFRFENEEELYWIRHICAQGFLPISIEENKTFCLQIPPDVKLTTVLLGSQPASQATLNYVKQYVEVLSSEVLSSKEMGENRFCLFVFCSQHIPGQMSLFQKIAEYLDQLKEYPPYLMVIPFSFQNDEAIAPLFYRSDATCTRSGGQTSMELMCVSSGETWIHSEAVGKEPTVEALLEGIPGWEAANALYLKKIKGAKMITPETIGLHLQKLFGKQMPIEHSNPPFESMA